MVYSVRMQCGRVLAKEAYVDADVVSSVPESGTAAAHGYSKQVIKETPLIPFVLYISLILQTSKIT